MPIGWGPASDMVRTVNKQRAGSVKRSLKESSESTSSSENGEKPLKFKEASPELLDEIRAKMLKAKKKRLITTLIMGAILLSIVIYVLAQPVYS